MRGSLREGGGIRQGFRKSCFDCLDQGGMVGRCAGTEAGQNGTASPDQKLIEVPRDGAGVIGISFFGGQERVKGVNVASFDGNFREQGKGNLKATAAELLDLRIRSRLLVEEVIGGECENGKPAGFITSVQRFETGILARESATAGGVDDQKDLPAILGKRYGFFLDVENGEIIDCFHRGNVLS